MMRISLVLLCVLVASCSDFHFPFDDGYDNPWDADTYLRPRHLASVASSPGQTVYSGAAVGTSSSGTRTYAAGRVEGVGTVNLGSTSLQTVLSQHSPLLVAYDGQGQVAWARTATEGSFRAGFNAVATAGDGSVVAAGYINNRGEFQFGPGVTVTSVSTYNALAVVKYSSDGNAIWARSLVDTGEDESTYNGVAVDASGNVYAVGYAWGPTTGSADYGLGQGVVLSVPLATSNAVVVKYNASGGAIWARTLSQASDYTVFSSVAVDGRGNLYVAGSFYGTGTYGLGGVSVSGSSAYFNAVLIKLSGEGEVLWARSTVSGSSNSGFLAVSVDADGQPVVAGDVWGGGSGVSFGPSVTARPAVDEGRRAATVVKYSAQGVALWSSSLSGESASTGSSASVESQFRSLAVDAQGSVYAAGFVVGPARVAMASSEGGSSVEILGTRTPWLQKLSALGAPIWGCAPTAGQPTGTLYAVAIDADGSVVAAGEQSGTAPVTWGHLAATSGVDAGTNAVLLRLAR